MFPKIQGRVLKIHQQRQKQKKQEQKAEHRFVEKIKLKRIRI